MPVSKELTIRMEDRPGILAKCCQSLAEHNVNILALQTAEGKGGVRMVVDNITNARKALDSQHLSYTENDVLQLKLPNRPGELGRAAARLGEANINIEHAYSGLDTNDSPVLFFGVKDVSHAVSVLDKPAKAA